MTKRDVQAAEYRAEGEATVRPEERAVAKPSPGSDSAVDAGCTCPVMDNCRGKGFLWGGAPAFWITESCPMHGSAKGGR